MIPENAFKKETRPKRNILFAERLASIMTSTKRDLTTSHHFPPLTGLSSAMDWWRTGREAKIEVEKKYIIQPLRRCTQTFCTSLISSHRFTYPGMARSFPLTELTFLPAMQILFSLMRRISIISLILLSKTGKRMVFHDTCKSIMKERFVEGCTTLALSGNSFVSV